MVQRRTGASRMKLPQPAEFEVYFRDPIWLEAGWAICKENGIVANRVARSEQGENVVLMIDQRFVVKIYEPSRDRIGRELSALEFASGKSELPIPEIVALGRIESYDYLV